MEMREARELVREFVSEYCAARKADFWLKKRSHWLSDDDRVIEKRDERAAAQARADAIAAQILESLTGRRPMGEEVRI